MGCPLNRALGFLVCCSFSCNSPHFVDLPRDADYLVVQKADGTYALKPPTGLYELSPAGRVFTINIPYEFDYLSETIDTDNATGRLPPDTVVHELTQDGFTRTGTVALADLRLPRIPAETCWLQDRCILSDACSESCEVSVPAPPAPPDYTCPAGWAPEPGLGVNTPSCRHPNFEAVAVRCGPNEILVGDFSGCVAASVDLAPGTWPDIPQSSPEQTFHVRPNAMGPCGPAPAECSLGQALAQIAGMTGAVGLALAPGVHTGEVAVVESGTHLYVFGAGPQTIIERSRWVAEPGAEISIRQVTLRSRRMAAILHAEEQTRVSIEEAVVECEDAHCLRTDGDLDMQHSLLVKVGTATVACENIMPQSDDVRCLPGVLGSATSTIAVRDSEIVAAFGLQTRGRLHVSGSRFRSDVPEESSLGIRTISPSSVVMRASAFVGVRRAIDMSSNLEGRPYEIDDVIIRPLGDEPIRPMSPDVQRLWIGIVLRDNQGDTTLKRVYVRGIDEGVLATASQRFEVADSSFVNLGTALIISESVVRPEPILVSNTWLGSNRGTPIVLYEESQLELRDTIVAAYNNGDQRFRYATSGAVLWDPEPVVLGTSVVRPKTSVPTLRTRRTAFEVREQTVFRGYLNLALIDTDVDLFQEGTLRRFIINTWELPASGPLPITDIDLERVEFRSRFGTSWIEAGELRAEDFVIKVDSPRGAPLCLANPASVSLERFRIEVSVPADQSEVVWPGFVSKMPPAEGNGSPDDSFPIVLQDGVLAGPDDAFGAPFQSPILCDAVGIDPPLADVQLDRVEGRTE